jgi:hypothetical protein
MNICRRTSKTSRVEEEAEAEKAKKVAVELAGSKKRAKAQKGKQAVTEDPQS